jgi:hypothetical protein
LQAERVCTRALFSEQGKIASAALHGIIIMKNHKAKANKNPTEISAAIKSSNKSLLSIKNGINATAIRRSRRIGVFRVRKYNVVDCRVMYSVTKAALSGLCIKYE